MRNKLTPLQKFAQIFIYLFIGILDVKNLKCGMIITFEI